MNFSKAKSGFGELGDPPQFPDDNAGGVLTRSQRGRPRRSAVFQRKPSEEYEPSNHSNDDTFLPYSTIDTTLPATTRKRGPPNRAPIRTSKRQKTQANGTTPDEPNISTIEPPPIPVECADGAPPWSTTFSPPPYLESPQEGSQTLPTLEQELLGLTPVFRAPSSVNNNDTFGSLLHHTGTGQRKASVFWQFTYPLGLKEGPEHYRPEDIVPLKSKPQSPHVGCCICNQPTLEGKRPRYSYPYFC